VPSLGPPAVQLEDSVYIKVCGSNKERDLKYEGVPQVLRSIHALHITTQNKISALTMSHSIVTTKIISFRALLS
jgi:hypothetical protein